MTQTADAIIIGTGVIGAALALSLSRQGWKTLSVDRNTQAGHGSTAGSCAIIRMHYSTFDGTALAWEGYHYWRDWAEYLGLPGDAHLAQFRETGCLVMKTAANGHLEKHMKYSGELDCPFEEWTAAEIEARLPIYSMDTFAPARRMDDPAFGEPTGGRLEGAVLWPRAGYVNDPALSAQNMMDAARQSGAALRTGSEVVEILQEGGRVKGVRLHDGEEVHAPVVVNVAGPGSSIVNRMAGVTEDMTIGTRPLRQEVVHVPAPEGFDFERDGLIVSDSDIACYVRPEQGNHILIGSEDPECDTHQWCEDDITYNRDFTDQWTTQAMRYAQRVPSLGIPGRTRGVVDLYDASTDWIPIYDKSSLPGFYMACGSSGNQYKNAPIAGEMMAALINYCEGGADHDAQPLQYRLPYVGREIDVGFYSRKRPINEESSFSVLG
ncbi:FAD-binding oxidoreductase [Roseovarius sp. TE539]|uniref:NAD(P)/FAD-dependent oxidoreductase n=1 Tax=Roseovarius sp. TE539 TaxID=2249812 RepID=UPI000DDF2E4B|nr:FAD-dependent oxidoreductase [Roseovarius sp. TE539]RBI73555.1 FAD-binding oxidoreductase [Roseovarius sp. TE539]